MEKKNRICSTKNLSLDRQLKKILHLTFLKIRLITKNGKAIHLSSLSEKIKELPHGLKTRVGTDGLKFSGGEKQRMALVRAIYHNHLF